MRVCQTENSQHGLVKLMSFSKHHRLRPLQSTKSNPLVKANSTQRNFLSAIPIPTPILSALSPKTGLPGITLPQTTIDLLLGPTAVQEQEVQVLPHSPSAKAPAAIEVIEEAGTTTEVEA